MTSFELPEVAWELADHCRTVLTSAERNAMFVHLGLSEYSDAMIIMLKAVARSGRPLPVPMVTKLTRVQQVHYLDQEFSDLLAAVA